MIFYFALCYPSVPSACPYHFFHERAFDWYEQPIYKNKIWLLFHVSHHIVLKALGKPHLATLHETYGISELLHQLIIIVSKNHQHKRWFYFIWYSQTQWGKQHFTTESKKQ